MKNKYCSVCEKYKSIKFFRFIERRGRKELQYGCNACHAKSQKRRVKRNPIKYARIQRNAYYKGKYGISLKQYETLFRKQKGRCACCGRKETQINPTSRKIQRLSVDHNHKTGRTRGLLCMFCNLYLLPAIESFPRLLIKAKRYLRRYHG